MSPEDRERYIQSLEEKYGVQHHGSGREEYRAEFSSTGEHGRMPPAGDSMQQEIMANSEMIDQMSPEERETYFSQMEEKYGLEPFHPQGEMPPDGHFGSYMDQFGTAPYPPFHGTYDYSGDQYFGEFDQHWDSASGTFVTNPYGTFYDPLQENINDLPPCSCACTGPNCGYNCKPVYCGSSSSGN